ncbi:Rieske (2Fe-2S) protein [Marinomonas sp. C2222]|uniref:Rieske (2Fe-2S) protein n=1 Tax=Marinomonas sargassi TaxID=2984494 RepID=A0ABT2YVG1_9GAMM|nr:Rieske (2Fe-2S) protein [Marinomonas sargassi]MCV2403848.1 Rieske (2Fe-2S) protein [Marinomonas sargassi]
MFHKYLIPNTSKLGEGEVQALQLANQDLLITKQQGQIIVYKNLCPHQNKRLNWSSTAPLDEDGDYIQCDHHGALFSLQDGCCITGPCSGMALQKEILGIEQGNYYLLLS